MKKHIIITAIFSLISILLLSSCSFRGPHFLRRFFDNDDDMANKRFESFLEAIENKDKAGLERMFSTKTITEVGNFSEITDELLNFLLGNHVLYDRNGGGGSDEDKDGEHRSKCVYSSYIVKTSEGEYCIAIKEFTIDTSDEDNVGISSLYIINADDTDERFTYWGDGEWTPGINFNKDYEED